MKEAIRALRYAFARARKSGAIFTLVLCSFAAAPLCQAHVGSPNVFFEGRAGAYPVRVVIRPPGVIPGLAEISVRVLTNGAERVTVLPMRWNTGREGAPSPDAALLVRGETNLFNAELWFMRDGAQSVEIEVHGDSGSGTAIIPVNAVATRVLEMPKHLGAILGAMGALLVALIVSIAGTAVRESVLPPGELPGRRRRWAARGIMLTSAAATAGLLWLGQRWWEAEAMDYRSNRLYRPMETDASVRMERGAPVLMLELTDGRFRQSAPLVPDHGKLMHLFLVREPGLDAFAHLHPIKRDWNFFETAVPDLPRGRYRLYADITDETGLADTLVSEVVLPAGLTERVLSGGALGFDPDDSWTTSERVPETGVGEREHMFPDGFAMVWLAPGPLVAREDIRLRFVVRAPDGRAVVPEPYMGMLGHLVLRRDDGSVFTHLHPSGTFSMAAQQLAELRAEGKAPLKAAAATADPICRLPSLEESQIRWLRANPVDASKAISFPYAFPKAGRYRLWMQVRLEGRVLTGVFDAEVR